MEGECFGRDQTTNPIPKYGAWSVVCCWETELLPFGGLKIEHHTTIDSLVGWLNDSTQLWQFHHTIQLNKSILGMDIHSLGYQSRS